MKGFMIRGWAGLALGVLTCVELSAPPAAVLNRARADGAQTGRAGLIAQAAGQKPTENSAGDKSPADQKPPVRRGLQFQELEDPVEYLDPVRRRTASGEARLDSLAHFARGRILHDRGNLPAALAAYEKALESDPTAVPVYRVLIRLAVDLQRVDEAIKWVTKATEADPADPQFLNQAVALLVDRRDLSLAIRVLERASRVPGIDKRSMQYVGIMRDLAVLNIEEDRKAEAVVGLEVVFDALTNPNKYNIPPAALDKLLKDKLIKFEKIGQAFLDANKSDLALAAFQKAAESTKDRASAINLSYSLAQAFLAGR